ncbi:hypothetical protein INR49_025651 [Caranx melampygus]|nr:hypothetical protein INR49_025651 [Caranx melampygus]
MVMIKLQYSRTAISTASLPLDNVYVRAWQGKMRVANPCPYWEDMERHGHSLHESSRNLN